LQAARQIKHILTGHLNASIDSNPSFPGKERHFLRAQIARITHSTVLVPAGFFKPNEEDDKKLDYDEEFAAK
jgi:radial spoke head protein 4A